MAQIFYESYYGIAPLFGDYIQHYQVKGAKWYKRRYQNEDGSLTPLGRKHYGVGEPRDKVKTDKGLARDGSWQGSKRNPDRDPSDKERQKKIMAMLADGASNAEIKLATGVDLGRATNRIIDASLTGSRSLTKEVSSALQKVGNVKQPRESIADKARQFSKDLEEGKRSAIRDKLDKKEAKAAEKAAKAAVKEALRKAKEDKKIQDIIRRADPKEVQKYLTKLNTKQLEEIKQRMDLKKGISELKSQSLEERKKQAAAEVEITKSRIEEKRAKREAIGEGISGALNLAKKVGTEIAETARQLKSESTDSKINLNQKLKSLVESKDSLAAAKHNYDINEEKRADEKAARKEEREGKVTNEARALAKEARSLTVEYAKKLAKEYGDQTLERIRKDPNLASNPERAFNELRSGIHRRMSGKGVPKDSYEEPERASSSNDNNKGKGTQQQQPKQNNNGGNGNQQQQPKQQQQQPKPSNNNPSSSNSQPSSSNSSNQPKADSGGTATRTVSGLLDKFRKIRKK